jgi:hypothetical protein
MRYESDKWKCSFCYDGQCEACESFTLTNSGVIKCSCVCNKPGMFGI